MMFASCCLFLVVCFLFLFLSFVSCVVSIVYVCLFIFCLRGVFMLFFDYFVFVYVYMFLSFVIQYTDSILFQRDVHVLFSMCCSVYVVSIILSCVVFSFFLYFLVLLISSSLLLFRFMCRFIFSFRNEEKYDQENSEPKTI